MLPYVNKNIWKNNSTNPNLSMENLECKQFIMHLIFH